MNLWRKPVVTLAGGIVVVLGLIMLVIPGPGLLMIAAGIAVWGTEYHWARRLLAWVKARFMKSKSNVGGKSTGEHDD